MSKRGTLFATLGFIVFIQYLMRREFLFHSTGLSQNKRQHHNHITSSAKSRLRSAGVGDDKRRPFVWYLHFHKAAGSSFTELAWQNQERLRHIQFLNSTTVGTDRHGHLELGASNKFRWNLLGGLHASSCELTPSTTIEQEQVRLLHEEITMLQHANVTFASTEHWFPSQNVMSQLQQKLDRPIITVVVLRHPLERVWSSYHFHGRHGGRCPPYDKRWSSNRVCPLDEWSKGESNMYVSMLNGLPFGPGIIRNPCTSQMRNVTSVNYERAMAALDQFDLVLTLESLQQKQQQQQQETTTITAASCALQQVLGWELTRLPKNHVTRQQRRPRPSLEEITKSANQEESKKQRQQQQQQENATTTITTLHPQVEADNFWDLKLYEYAKKLESQHFANLQCG